MIETHILSLAIFGKDFINAVCSKCGYSFSLIKQKDGHFHLEVDEEGDSYNPEVHHAGGTGGMYIESTDIRQRDE